MQLSCELGWYFADGSSHVMLILPAKASILANQDFILLFMQREGTPYFNNFPTCSFRHMNILCMRLAQGRFATATPIIAGPASALQIQLPCFPSTLELLDFLCSTEPAAILNRPYDVFFLKTLCSPFKHFTRTFTTPSVISCPRTRITEVACELSAARLPKLLHTVRSICKLFDAANLSQEVEGYHTSPED